MNLKYIPHLASYSVCLSSVCPFFSDKKSTLAYDIQVRHLKTLKEEHYIEIKKTNTLLNEEELHDAFNDMLLQTAVVLDTVIVRMDNNGKLVGLSNYNEIKQKWFRTRARVSDMYQGDTATRYLDQMQMKLETQEILWDTLNKSFFHTVFFNGIYNNYKNTFSTQQEMVVWDLLPAQEIEITVEKKIQVNKETDVLLMFIKGDEKSSVLDQRSKDFFKNIVQADLIPDSCIVAVEGVYTIHPKNASIDSITMEMNVSIENIYQKKMQINVIRLPD